MNECLLCVEQFSDLSGLLNHIRLFHPDDFPEQWPDGGLVFYDEEIL